MMHFDGQSRRQKRSNLMSDHRIASELGFMADRRAIGDVGDAAVIKFNSPFALRIQHISVSLLEYHSDTGYRFEIQANYYRLVY
jgi:hypothetical protein